MPNEPTLISKIEDQLPLPSTDYTFVVLRRIDWKPYAIAVALKDTDKGLVVLHGGEHTSHPLWSLHSVHTTIGEALGVIHP